MGSTVWCAIIVYDVRQCRWCSFLWCDWKNVNYALILFRAIYWFTSTNWKWWCSWALFHFFSVPETFEKYWTCITTFVTVSITWSPYLLKRVRIVNSKHHEQMFTWNCICFRYCETTMRHDCLFIIFVRDFKTNAEGFFLTRSPKTKRIWKIYWIDFS